MTNPPQSQPPSSPIRKPMLRLRVGGADGLTPSESLPISSQYMETSVCGDGTVRVSIHVYLDPHGGEPIPAKPMLINGVPQYEKNRDGSTRRDSQGRPVPKFWPSSRLLGETTVTDSLLTVMLPLGPSGKLIPVHIGGFARVTIARTASIDDALSKYDSRDSFSARDAVTDDYSTDEPPPFIPSHAAQIRSDGSPLFPKSAPLSAHNLPTPLPRSNL